MSLHLATIQLLDFAVGACEGLSEGEHLPAEARFAASKLSEVRAALQVEPLHLSDIEAAVTLLREARPGLTPIHKAEWPAAQAPFAEGAILAWDALHARVRLDTPKVQTLPNRLRRLLHPAWWGSGA